MTERRLMAVSAGSRVSPQLFQSLALSAPGREAGRRGATFVVSAVLHSTLALTLLTLPLLLGNALPSVDPGGLFTPPIVEIRVLPPPPAAPAGGVRTHRAPREARPQRSAFVAPSVDVASTIEPDDLFADDTGGDTVGIPGGVVGLSRAVGSVVHVPQAAPPAPPRLVRISQIAAPQPIERVTPVYPELAARIGLTGVVVVEAEVDTTGRVRTARTLSGHELLIGAALDAVKQWRYRPLLLNGEPTAFILNVNVEFRIRRE